MLKYEIRKIENGFIVKVGYDDHVPLEIFLKSIEEAAEVIKENLLKNAKYLI